VVKSGRCLGLTTFPPSENVGVSTSRNPKDLHSLYRDKFTFIPRPKSDMAGTRQNKASEVKLKTTRNVLDLGRKSMLSIENQLILYKCIIKPIWTYGTQLWDCTKPSNKKIIQRLLSKILRSVTSSPWNVSNFTLHNNL
jgi:hypothetical protein